MSSEQQRRQIALALEYPLMQQGGVEVLVRTLLQGLSPHYDIVLVSGDKSRAELPPEFSKLINAHLSWNQDTQSSAPARTLAASLCQHGIQFAHFHFGGTFAWSSNRFWRCPAYHLAGMGVPCLSTNHLATQWLNCGVNPARPVWQKQLYQFFAIFSRSLLYRRLKLEVCVSRHDRDRVARMFPHLRRKLVYGYHSRLPAQAPLPALQPREPVILSAGTICGRKGQTILARAFARIASRHPLWRVDLVGRIDSEEDAKTIRACAAERGLNDRLRLLGPKSYEETLEQMKRASIFAIPSLLEGLGLSLQEALYHGCAAVGSRVGGIPELIDDQVNGLLVPPGDIEALSAALDKLMSDNKLLEKFGTQGRPSIIRKGMTADAMVKAYLEIYNSL